jgi:gas vesicle protein
MMTQAKKDSPGTIILASLAGAGAGALAGVLLAPDSGRATRHRLKQAASRYSQELGEQAARILDELQATVSKSALRLGALVPGSAESGGLHLKNEWPSIKNKLQKQYAHLTNQDLAYVEGKGRELVSRLQRKLSKSEAAIIALLNAM